MRDGTEWLDEIPARALLLAYGIPTVRTEFARDGSHAATLAHDIGYPVALKGANTVRCRHSGWLSGARLANGRLQIVRRIR